jgi:hypothetical protein
MTHAQQPSLPTSLVPPEAQLGALTATSRFYPHLTSTRAASPAPVWLRGPRKCSAALRALLAGLVFVKAISVSGDGIAATQGRLSPCRSSDKLSCAT